MPTVATDAFACNRHRSVDSPGTAFRVGVSIPVNFGTAAAPAQLRDSPTPDTAADTAAVDVSGEAKAPKPSGASLTLLDTIGAYTLFRCTKAAVMQVGRPGNDQQAGGRSKGSGERLALQRRSRT